MGGACSLELKILSERVLALFRTFKLLYSISYAEKLNVSTTYFVKGKSNGKHQLLHKFGILLFDKSAFSIFILLFDSFLHRRINAIASFLGDYKVMEKTLRKS